MIKPWYEAVNEIKDIEAMEEARIIERNQLRQIYMYARAYATCHIDNPQKKQYLEALVRKVMSYEQ